MPAPHWQPRRYERREQKYSLSQIYGQLFWPYVGHRTATSRSSPDYRNMAYKGIEYQIVQTSNPTGWKWAVEMEGRTPRVGSGYSRAAAIALAQIAIDKLVKQNPGEQSDQL